MPTRDMNLLCLVVYVPSRCCLKSLEGSWLYHRPPIINTDAICKISAIDLAKVNASVIVLPVSIYWSNTHMELILEASTCASELCCVPRLIISSNNSFWPLVFRLVSIGKTIGCLIPIALHQPLAASPIGTAERNVGKQRIRPVVLADAASIPSGNVLNSWGWFGMGRDVVSNISASTLRYSSLQR